MSEPLPCASCNGYQRIGLRLCAECDGSGHARCECGDLPAVTTSLTDRDIKLCAACARDDERDVRAFLVTTGLSADAIERFFALAPRLTDEQIQALIPLPDEAYRAEIELLVATKGAA